MKFVLLIILFLFCLPGFGQEDTKAKEVSGTPTEEILPELDAAKELEKLGYESINAKALTDERVIRLIKRMMEESDIHEASPELIKQLIHEKLKDSYLGAFLKSNPKLLDLLVDIMRDKKALIGLIDIFLRREDLKSYLHFWIAFLIAAWLIKKATFKKEWGFWKTFGMGLLASVIVTSVSMTIFYNTFKKELTPALEIISKHL